jgi:hypothetical protein
MRLSRPGRGPCGPGPSRLPKPAPSSPLPAPPSLPGTPPSADGARSLPCPCPGAPGPGPGAGAPAPGCSHTLSVGGFADLDSGHKSAPPRGCPSPAPMPPSEPLDSALPCPCPGPPWPSSCRGPAGAKVGPTEAKPGPPGPTGPPTLPSRWPDPALPRGAPGVSRDGPGAAPEAAGGPGATPPAALNSGGARPSAMAAHTWRQAQGRGQGLDQV